MKRLLDFFRGKQAPSAPTPPSAPTLRNVAGGYAWIKNCDGDEAPLNGRAVKTVRFVDGAWQIEPEHPITLTSWVRDICGDVSHPGPAVVVGMADANLEPWKDTGLTDEEVRDLFAPKQTERA